MEIPRIESVGIAGLGQQLLGLGGIIGVWVDWQRKLESLRHDASGWW